MKLNSDRFATCRMLSCLPTTAEPPKRQTSRIESAPSARPRYLHVSDSRNHKLTGPADGIGYAMGPDSDGQIAL